MEAIVSKRINETLGVAHTHGIMCQKVFCPRLKCGDGEPPPFESVIHGEGTSQMECVDVGLSF